MVNLNQDIQNLNDKDWSIGDCCIEGAEVLQTILNSFNDLQVKFKLKAKSFTRYENRIYFGRNSKFQIVIHENKIAYVGRNDGTFAYDEFAHHSYQWHELCTKPNFLKRVILHYINQ